MKKTPKIDYDCYYIGTIFKDIKIKDNKVMLKKIKIYKK